MEQTMCDIHMHLIPGADDGAETMETALLMLKGAHDQGVREIFATPHSYAFDRNAQAVKEAFAALHRTAARFFPDMALYTGCEVLCDCYGMENILSRLEAGRYPTLNGTNYVLTEFSPWGTAEETERCLTALISAGYIPVIAHMERYPFLHDRWDRIEAFRAMGCLIQINAYSLAEEKDPRIKNLARELAKQKMADFLGTDAHSSFRRPPRVEQGIRWITENCEEAYARSLLRENTRQLLIRKEGSPWIP